MPLEREISLISHARAGVRPRSSSMEGRSSMAMSRTTRRVCSTMLMACAIRGGKFTAGIAAGSRHTGQLHAQAGKHLPYLIVQFSREIFSLLLLGRSHLRRQAPQFRFGHLGMVFERNHARQCHASDPEAEQQEPSRWSRPARRESPDRPWLLVLAHGRSFRSSSAQLGWRAPRSLRGGAASPREIRHGGRFFSARVKSKAMRVGSR